MNITTFEYQYTPEMIVERAKRDNSTSGIWSALTDILGDNTLDKPYERIYRVYFPLFIIRLDINFSNEEEKSNSDDIIIGVNAITGSVGQIDRLPVQQELDVDSNTVLYPVLNETEARSKSDEWLFKHIDREHRTLRMPQYEAEACNRHLLYWLVDLGSFEHSYAINDLTGRRDSIDSLKGIDTYYNNIINKKDGF